VVIYEIGIARVADIESEMAVFAEVLKAGVDQLDESRIVAVANIEYNKKRAHLMQNRDDCSQIVMVRVLDGEVE